MALVNRVNTIYWCYIAPGAKEKYVHVSFALLQSPVVMWKMKAPEKKPLVRRENLEEGRGKIRKGEQKKKIEPIKALSEFEA